MKRRLGDQRPQVKAKTVRHVRGNEHEQDFDESDPNATSSNRLDHSRRTPHLPNPADLPSGYRDRAAERRNHLDDDEGSKEGTKYAEDERPKGLDLKLLDLQRKGVKLVDVLEGDPNKARLKLLETKISQIFPDVDTRSVIGWQCDTRYVHPSAVPKPLFGQAREASREDESSGGLLTASDIRLIFQIWKSRHSSNNGLKPLQVAHASQEGEDIPGEFVREVEDISDDDDTTPSQKSKNKNSMVPALNLKNDSDDDFDMFDGAVLATNENLSLKVKTWEELSVEELRSMLKTIDQAIEIQQTLLRI